MFCQMESSSLDLLRSVNITPITLSPEKRPHRRPLPIPTDPHPPDHNQLHLQETRPNQNHRRSPNPPPADVYDYVSRYSFYISAKQHFTVAESRIKLFPESSVSLYDARYTSLAANSRLPRIHHNLTSFSLLDRKLLLEEIDEVMHNYANAISSGSDWIAIAQTVYERYADRIEELRGWLDLVDSVANATALLEDVRLASFSLVMPYLSGEALSIWPEPPSLAARKRMMLSSRRDCRLAYTKHLVVNTRQERRLKQAIEEVVTRICQVAFDIAEGSIGILDSQIRPDESKVKSNLIKWQKQLKDLMDWLYWSSWIKCPRQCEFDGALCYKLLLKLQ